MNKIIDIELICISILKGARECSSSSSYARKWKTAICSIGYVHGLITGLCVSLY